jgi:hypothetical protein
MVALAAVLGTSRPHPAAAHSWYPLECCHDQDCAPVDRVQSLPNLDGFYVTTALGSALVPATFPKRESKDGRMHVCLRKQPNGKMRVLCLFVPPES